MNTEEAVSALESEWTVDSGSLWKLRQGDYDEEGLNRLCKILRMIDIDSTEYVSRRLVSLIWMLPIFFEWQRDRVLESMNDKHQYSKMSNDIWKAVQDLLGIP